MTPSVARIVHYVAYGTPGGEYKAGAHRAAMITQVHSDTCVDIVIFNPTGLFFAASAMFDSEAGQPGSWHWPERVE